MTWWRAFLDWFWPRDCTVLGHAMVRSIYTRETRMCEATHRPVHETMWYCDRCGQVEWLNSLVGFAFVHRVDGQPPPGPVVPTADERALIAESRAAWDRQWTGSGKGQP